MTRRSKLELLEALRPRYGKAGKKAKGRMLGEFCAATKYNRKYAIQLLRHGPPRSKKGKPGRRPRYGGDVIAALVEVWQASGHICGKRMHPFLPELVEALERHGELRLAPEVKSKLLQMSRATIDRRLQRARSQLPVRGRTTTRPGSLLKSAIPIRTFADWDDARPGFLEIDLVAHCGETTAGEYLHTLSAVDIDTRWYEPVRSPTVARRPPSKASAPFAVHCPFRSWASTPTAAVSSHLHLQRRCKCHLHPLPPLQEERPGVCRAKELDACPLDHRLSRQDTGTV